MATKIAVKVAKWRPVFSDHVPNSRDFARRVFVLSLELSRVPLPNSIAMVRQPF